MILLGHGVAFTDIQLCLTSSELGYFSRLATSAVWLTFYLQFVMGVPLYLDGCR